MVESLSEGTAQKMKPIVAVLASPFANLSQKKMALNSVLSLNDFLSVSFHDIIYWDINWLFVENDPTLTSTAY